MAETKSASNLKGLRVLAVDDEQDILDTIEEVLDEAQVDQAKDYDSASQAPNCIWSILSSLFYNSPGLLPWLPNCCRFPFSLSIPGKHVFRNYKLILP